MGDIKINKMKKSKRRQFISRSGTAIIGASLGPLLFQSCAQKKAMIEETAINTKAEMMKNDDMFFKISLAQWSFHKAIFAKELDHLDFAAKTKSLGIDGIEYVNQFFKDKAEDKSCR